MISPWKIRFGEALYSTKRYTDIINGRIKPIDIKEIERTIFNSYNIAPSTNDFKLYPFKELDYKQFMAYHYAIETDSNFISKYLDVLERAAKDYEILLETERIALEHTRNRTTKFLALLSTSTFIDGITREIQIPDEIELLSSSASVTGAGIAMNVESSSISNRGNYIPNDINIIVTEQTTQISNQVNGDKVSILTDSYKRGVAFSVFTQAVEQVSAQFTLSTRANTSNRMTLELTPAAVGMRIKVSILPSVGTQLIELFNNVINHELLTIEFTPNPVERVIIEMTKNLPDIKVPGSMVYNFYLEKLRLENTKIARNANIISTVIELPDGTDYVSVLAEDYVPPGNTVRYEVATVTDITDIPTEWFALLPTNQNPISELDAGRLPTDRFLSMNLDKVSKEISKEFKWDLPIEAGYEVRLYNILNGINEELSPEISINNGVIEAAAGNTIIEDSVVVYHGISDWEVITEQPIIEKALTNVIFELDFNNVVSNWFEPIKLVEEEILNVKPTISSNTINVANEPIQPDNIVIEDDNGKQLATIVNAITDGGNDTWNIELSSTLVAGTIYRLRYLYAIEDITEVLFGTLSITAGDVTLIESVDYIFTESEKKVMLLKSGNVVDEDTVLLMNYDIKKPDDEKIFYRTWITLDRRRTINITPFTALEVSRGNFHRIGNQDLSLSTGVELEPGTYKVESTQPEPTSSIAPTDEDVNPYTNNKSDAAIILTEVEYIAYKDPMNKVTLSDMEFNVTRNNPNVYIYNDGKILLNTIPSYIEKAILDSPDGTPTVGAYLRNKSITIIGSTIYYTPRPERYTLQFSYISENARRLIRLRVIMSRGSEETIRISRLGVTPIKLE